ncbi:hypothetical protein WCD74_22080 [Actinomycetospora sp. OC33-EN08]|uniref:Uncharacterized protein n=1 Tax=Actinomycetospora aurantiaca TaxID=3129233 RepID=A0ABU8MT28_9PSEU
MQTLLLSAPRALVGALVLQLFFAQLRTNWPANYYALSDILAASISRSWQRYILFRLGPVLVTAVLVAATGPDSTADITLSTTLFAALHCAFTTIRSFTSDIRRRSLVGRKVLADLAVTVLIFATCAIGALLSPAIRQYVPGFDKYVEVLLTGVVAALAYGYLSRWTAGEPPPDSRSALLAGVPATVLKATEERAARYKVDQHLALSVLAVEYRQRPAWMARTERLASWTGLVRTYGPFQNLTDRRATWEQSVDTAMQSLVGADVVRRDGWVLNMPKVQAHLEKLNEGKDFLDHCAQALNVLTGSLVAQCDSPGVDGTPRIRCTRLSRVGFDWLLEGDVSAEVEHLGGLIMKPTVSNFFPAIVPDGGQGGRRYWVASCSVDALAVQVIAPYSDPLKNPDVLHFYMSERGE